MRGKILIVCAVATLAGCAHHRFGTEHKTACQYYVNARVNAEPSAARDATLIKGSPRGVIAADTEEKGPEPEINATRNWSRDILPIEQPRIREQNVFYGI